MPIVPLFAVIGKFTMFYETLMQQTTQLELIKQALSAEVANVVAVVAIFLAAVIVVIVRMMGTRQKSEERIVSLLIGTDSPIVQAMNRFTTAMQDSKKAHEDTNSAIIALSKDVKERSKLDGEAFKEHEDHIDERFDKVETKVEDVATIQKDIDAKLSTIIAELQKRNDCSDIIGEVKALRDEMRDKLKTQPLVNAVTPTTTVVETTNVILRDTDVDAGAALPKAS